MPARRLVPDGVAVAHDEAREAPRLAKEPVLKLTVRAGRDAVDSLMTLCGQHRTNITDRDATVSVTMLEKVTLPSEWMAKSEPRTGRTARCTGPRAKRTHVVGAHDGGRVRSGHLLPDRVVKFDEVALRDVGVAAVHSSPGRAAVPAGLDVIRLCVLFGDCASIEWGGEGRGEQDRLAFQPAA